MARIRTVKPEFWTSENVGRLPRDARLVFLALFNCADDEGRFRASPLVLAGAILPYDEDREAVIMKALSDLSAAGMVQVYEHSGSRYGVVTGFKKHQKISHPAKSKAPAPEDPGSKILDLLRNPPEDLRSPLEGLGEPPRGSGIRDQGREGKGAGIRDLVASPQMNFEDPSPAPEPSADETSKPEKKPRERSVQEDLHAVFLDDREKRLRPLGLYDPDHTVKPALINTLWKPILDFARTTAAPLEVIDCAIEAYLDLEWGEFKTPAWPAQIFLSRKVWEPLLKAQAEDWKIIVAEREAAAKAEEEPH